MKIFFGNHENRYKVNLHCHTRNSDGRATPETVKEEYKKRGYSAVAFTDHQHLINMKHLSDEDFIAITGCEMSVAGPKVDLDSPTPSAKQLHMCFYAKDPDCDITPCYNEKRDWYKFDDLSHLVKSNGNYTPVFSHEGINDMIRIGHEMGFLVSINHPTWSLINAEDYLGYDGFDFVEVYNTGSSVSGFNETDVAYGDMMKAGKSVMPIATDDNHNIFGFEGRRSDSFGGWVVLDAPALSYENIMTALEDGDFYASTGPEIHSIVLDDEGVLRVKCSPVVSAYLITQGRRHGHAYADLGETIESASFKFRCADVRFRIKIVDDYGRCAYSRIYDLPEDTPRVDAETK